MLKQVTGHEVAEGAKILHSGKWYIAVSVMEETIKLVLMNSGGGEYWHHYYIYGATPKDVVVNSVHCSVTVIKERFFGFMEVPDPSPSKWDRFKK